MILKELQLQNIRSYTELPPLQFPEGVSLFYGDVASGKSSLLYAIEFALFGLAKGELEGQMLLRNEATEGAVSVKFEEGGKEYSAYRKLRRTKRGVNQIEGKITEDGEEHSYDVSEMKLRILEILKLSEKPQTGTSSVIYRYGIFTPQERIKDVMLASPDVRLQILRRAFRLDRYAIAVDNVEGLSKHLSKVEIKILETEAEGLEEKEVRRDALIGDVDKNNNRISQLQKEIDEIEARLLVLRKREAEDEKSVREIEKYQAQIPLLNDQCEREEKRIVQLKEELNKLEKEKIELANKQKQLQLLQKPTEKSEDKLAAELVQIEEQQTALVAQRARAEEAQGRYQMLVDQGVCPTCERPVDDPSLYRNKYDKACQQVSESLEEEGKAKKDRDSLNTLLQNLRQYHTSIVELTGTKALINSKSEAIATKAEELKQTETHLENQRRELGQMEKSVKSNDKLLHTHEQTKQSIIDSQDLRNSKTMEIKVLEERNSGLLNEKRLLEEEIQRGKTALAKIGAYREVVNYLEQYFVPTIRRIETIVLQAIYDEFNNAFQKYFAMIIGLTEIEAWIDEEFSAVVMQDSYEMPYQHLSGGERTSLALAYRLALNQTVRRLANLEKGLLVLDEPTEGLSYAQVLNLREVLDDLGCDQTIVVSHENQFLGFSDHVFSVNKAGHVSTVKQQ